MSTHTHIVKVNGREVRIHTDFVYPPVPSRDSDWSAVTDDFDLGHPIGWGCSEQRAIAALVEQLEE